MFLGFSTAIGLKTVFNLSASGANDFSIIATVHAEWKPEQWPEKAEQTNAPSEGGTSCALPPSTHSIKSTHGTWHG